MLVEQLYESWGSPRNNVLCFKYADINFPESGNFFSVELTAYFADVLQHSRSFVKVQSFVQNLLLLSVDSAPSTNFPLRNHKYRDDQSQYLNRTPTENLGSLTRAKFFNNRTSSSDEVKK